MSKYIPGNQKHLSVDDRKFIQKALDEGQSFKDIARSLCKDQATISKEVKKHRLDDWFSKGSFYNVHNHCVHCQRSNACGKFILCDVKCASCPTCNQHCMDFVREYCPHLYKAPYVCNGCDKPKQRCTIPHKYFYDALFADRKYRKALSGFQAGINMTKHKLAQKDKLVFHLICQGQSPYQIAANHPELDMSVRSIYTYINKGYFTAKKTSI